MLNGAVPPFDIQGGVAVAVFRFLFIAALCSACGTLAVRLLSGTALARTPPASAERLARRLDRLASASLLVCLASGLFWLALEAASMSEAEDFAEFATALPAVAWHTEFGRLVLLQLAACMGAGLALWWRGRGFAAVAGAGAMGALLLQAGHSHAWAMEGGLSWLLAADAVHLVSAALWLGGLVPLLLLVRDTPARAGLAAARSFATMGRLCVFGLIGSAVVQSWALIGSVPGLFGTAYGWVALVKLALLAVLLGFAASNRYRLAPLLMGAEPQRARSHLVRSIAVQTGFGVAVVAAAVVLTSLPPSIHVQPVWPFSVRPSLDAINEDPDFRREVLWAVGGLAVAVVLLGAAIVVRRRWRAPAVACAVLIALLAVPHLDLLLAEASPTTYARSPTGFASSSIARGAALYPRHCAACHGALGRGDGPAASGLRDPPADLTAAHLWMHSDGELFGWLSDGIADPGGDGLAMPGFRAVLSEDDRWALIDMIRARNAGLVHAATGNWAPALRAPGFSALCGNGPRDLAAFQGQVVLLTVGASAPPPPPDVASVLAGPADSDAPCVTDDPAVPEAYAIASGIAPGSVAGTLFVIDGNGWLRAALPEPRWRDPKSLAAAVARARPPLAGGSPPMHMPM